MCMFKSGDIVVFKAGLGLIVPGKIYMVISLASGMGMADMDFNELYTLPCTYMQDHARLLDTIDYCEYSTVINKRLKKRYQKQAINTTIDI